MKTAMQITCTFLDALASIQECGKDVKATFKTREKAKAALIPTFAKKLDVTKYVSYDNDEDKNVIGWIAPNEHKQVKKASDQLKYLLNVAFAPKPSSEGNKGRFDYAAWATRIINTCTKDQVERRIQALRDALKA